MDTTSGLRRDDIAFAGLLIRKTDGTTWAIDLDGKHVRIMVDMTTPYAGGEDIPMRIDDVPASYGHSLLRLDVHISADRRMNGDLLFTLRQLQPGDEPFPAEQKQPS